MRIAAKSTPIALLLSGVISLATSIRDRNDHAEAVPQHDAKQTAAGVRAPIAEVLHCPLAFSGVHLLKDDPKTARTAYHFCKPLNDDVNQCLLYDGTGPNAKLIGVEYLVSDKIYRSMPESEKTHWHDHLHEVDSGLIRSLTQTGKEEAETLAAVRTLWGKVYHTWIDGEIYPQGPARLFWSVTGKEPFLLPKDFTLPPELRSNAPR
ncbi:MAG: DUF1264 domain-containing protein [Isosphaeraceae bacterium]|nr:DUF1264 domain-containing protein [Isosphaeraceae bacterium]